MTWYEYTFTYTSDVDPDIISAVWASELGEAGFEGFTETADGLKGYIPEALHDPEALLRKIRSFPLDDVAIHFSRTEMEDKDWNEEWEKNYFQPIVIADRCMVHASFHEVNPDCYTYHIVINPKMAFGTGHHETTALMMEAILASDLSGKAVLDMGCGTAVLSILAVMKGASSAVAVDIDGWACRNALENIRLNRVEAIRVIQGGAGQLPAAETFDAVFANINRNILLDDVRHYALCMKPGAILLLSGFYTEDIPAIQKECSRNGLTFLSSSEKNHWAIVRVRKEP
ncbi:MAG: 50S ribosomal protein L11 methyltransferase [Tannerellaceae bacterium]|jgi:ribosomal protein L11 methyltransferase|nr:50S ribosomal protein L11 methyltransferase [Tannerellaceae bacterium]